MQTLTTTSLEIEKETDDRGENTHACSADSAISPRNWEEPAFALTGRPRLAPPAQRSFGFPSATWSNTAKTIVQIVASAAMTIEGIPSECPERENSESEVRNGREHPTLRSSPLRLGIVHTLYNHGVKVIEGKKTIKDFVDDPLAKTFMDLVTPKQLGIMRALGRTSETNVDDECHRLLRCETAELSRGAASSLIDHLQSLKANESGCEELLRAS